MKKLLLSLAVLTVAGSAFADNYLIGDLITPQTALTPGEHKVILEVITKNTKGFLHTLAATDDNIYFGAKDPVKIIDDEFTEDYVYTINVDDQGQFTMKNSTGAFCPIPTQSSTSVYMYSNTTDETAAGKLAIMERTAANNSYTDYYMLQLVNSSLSHVEMHLDGNGNNPVVCFFTTGDAGINDAGGSARTACAVKMYEAKSLAFPIAGEWYRLKNRETSSGRDNAYLGYYPETSWYVFSHTNGSRADKVVNPFVTTGNLANEAAAATEDEINGQLWTFVEGSGNNAGKYCMVNKAFPEGAISNVIVNNNGETITSLSGNNATNASRWQYVSNREENADAVCWFDFSQKTTADDIEYVRPTFENPINTSGIYMAIAAAPQNYQTIRITDSNEASTWWAPVLDVAFDAETTYNEGVAELKAIAEGFAAMKGAIDNEELPQLTLPENATAADVAAAITEANEAYQAYINKFNGKLVTLKNNRRTDRSQNPWLAIYMRNGSASTNTLAEATDDATWQLVVESNKVRFYNLTTGYQLRSNLMIPQAVDGGVRLQINGSANYLNIDTMGNDVCDYSDANDPGSIWTVESHSYTFCQPEVSTAEAPKYYRILSDRWMAGKASSALCINGENRDATGEGEQVSRAQLGANGTYWRLEAGEGNAVKIYNLVDGYAIGRADNNSTIATMREEAAEPFYLINLENIALANGNNFTIANSYAISSEENIGNATCVDAANYSPYPIKIAEWSPVRAENNHNNLENNGSVWYFILASDDEVAAATENYVAAVSNRLPNNDLENITALAGKDAAEEYAGMLTNDADLTTIAGVNLAKRNASGLADVMSKVLDNHIVGQHVQLSATKTDWDIHYLSDNGTQIVGTTDATALSTLWTIAKGAEGYTFTNESTGRVITFGNDSASSAFPTSDNADEAYEFAMTYIPASAKFGIHKRGSSLTDQRAIHMADNNGRIVKWSASGIANSQWYISALADADFEVTYDEATSQYQLTIGGEITDHAVSNDMQIVISAVNEEAEEAAPASRTAVADGGKTITISASELQANKTILLPSGDGEGLVSGKYTISVPGAMMTVNGQHTRATSNSFTVNEDGSVTGINEVAAPAVNLNGACFDLQGRRVMNPTRKGIYIINGRKVMVK